MAYSEQQYREAIDVHLRHECEQLRHCAVRLGQVQPGTGDYKALVESFAIHARNLVEFLWLSRNPSADDDLRAGDFVAGPSWPTVTSKGLTGVPKRIWEQANKQINHLTMDRIEKTTNFEWRVADIVVEIDTRFRQLVRQAEPKWQAALTAVWPAIAVLPKLRLDPTPSTTYRPTVVSTPTIPIDPLDGHVTENCWACG